MNRRVFRAQAATGAIDETLTPVSAFQIEEIRLHLDAAGGATEDFTAVLDSDAGTRYDVLILSQDMELVSDIIYQPPRPLIFSAGDVIDFGYTNTNGRDWGLEVYWTPIY